MSRARQAVRGISALTLIVGAAAAHPQTGGQAAGTVDVHVDWSQHVSTDAGDALHVEPWLALNPRDPRHLVATAMVPDLGGSVLYASNDGGRSWKRATESGTGSGIFDEFDPVVEFAPDGTPYFATLADGFTVWRGEDGGATWRRLGIVPGGSYDREWIGFDSSGGAHHGRMYTAGKVPIHVLGSHARDVAAFSSSDDGGRSFRQARLIMPNPAEGGLNVVNHMLVLPDGSLIAAYQFFRWSQLGRNALIEGEMQVLLSRDGNSWEGPFTAGPLRVYGNNAEESLMVKGLGGGRLASGDRDGRIHLTWLNELEGVLQLFIASSDDGGRTWSRAMRVNDGGLRSNHSNPAIAVNASGDVMITWNDRRDDPSDRCFRLYATASVDGGRSFLSSVPVTSSPACPPDGRWLNGGDTQGLVALPDGSFQALWIGAIEDGGGPLQLWTSRISIR